MKPRIYIAGPISKGNQFHNVANGIKAASEVYKLGAIPFCPHLTALWDFVDQSMTCEDWMTICFAWIPTCHAMLRIPGESAGADREVEFAKSLGIRVVYSMDEVIDIVGNSGLPPQHDSRFWDASIERVKMMIRANASSLEEAEQIIAELYP